MVILFTRCPYLCQYLTCPYLIPHTLHVRVSMPNTWFLHEYIYWWHVKPDFCRNIPDFLVFTRKKLCKSKKKTAGGPCKQEENFFVVSCIQSSLVPFSQEKNHGKYTTGGHKQTLSYSKCNKTNLQPEKPQLGKGIWMCSSIGSNCQNEHIYLVPIWHILVVLSAYIIECLRVSKADETVVLWERRTLSKIFWKTKQNVDKHENSGNEYRN